MKKINLTGQLLVLSVVFLFSSCITNWFGVTGKGSIVTETRQVSSFNSVDLTGAADVEITKGDSLVVKVSNYENIIQYLYLEVEDNTLIIRNEPETTILFNSKAKVQITMPDPLYAAYLTGSGNFTINSGFNDLNTLKIIGSGNMNITENGSYNDLDVRILGSGDITAKGTVNSLTAKIVGSGNLKLANLVAVNSDCAISGSGNIYTNATSSLKATISGSGTIEYSGTPTVNTSITGSGSVNHK